jgi:hypothetical protein
MRKQLLTVSKVGKVVVGPRNGQTLARTLELGTAGRVSIALTERDHCIAGRMSQKQGAVVPHEQG